MSKLDFVMAQVRQARVARSRNHLWRRFWAEHPLSAGQCGLIADPGIGDHFLLCAFAAEVNRKTGLEVHVAGNSRYQFLRDLFSAVTRFVPWPAGLPGMDFGTVHVAEGNYMRSFQSGLCRAIGYGDFHFVDAYRCRLGLGPETQLTNPRLPHESEVHDAEAFWRNQGFEPGRIAILAIDARSTPTAAVGLRFWQDIAACLESSGIKAVVNRGLTTPEMDRIPSLALPLDKLRALAMTAGRVCTVRSGLSDLFCGLPCRQAVIYPDIDYFSGRLITGTNVARFGLPNPPKEFLFRGGDEAILASEVARFLGADTGREQTL